MYYNKKFTVGSLLSLVAMAMFLIVSAASVTAAGGGTTPASAVPLDADSNTGELAPFEQHWFVFTPAQSGKVSLSLTITGEGSNTIKFVSLKLFDSNQITTFDPNGTNEMVSKAQIVVDQNTPKIAWTGSLVGSATYYVQILNESDYSVEYDLVFESVSQSVPKVASPDLPDVVGPAVASNDPDKPRNLEKGLTKGRLQPNSTYWYTFQYDNTDGTTKRFQELDFSMFFTPDDGNRKHHVNFELFRVEDYESWRRGGLKKLDNFGAGMLVSRDGDYNTGERIWRGVVMTGKSYKFAVRNGSDVVIDYWIYDDDIYNPILGPLPEAQPAMVFAQGAAPQTSRPLKIGLNKDGLDPGEEAWYSFKINDFGAEKAYHEMALTMITTPDDGNLIRRMTFDVFSNKGVWYWSPGDNSQINNIGAGSVVYRDTNPLTGERFWHGWVLDNDTYYVQIRNGNDIHMDYWLYTGDVYSPELGEATKQTVRKADPGTAPYAAIDLEVGVNKGKLNPGNERWYKFSRGDGTTIGGVETIFTLHFTPDDGNRIRKVNLELFEEKALSEWAPDNRFNIVSFGRGNVVSRDGNPETGELIWRGNVLTGQTYYMRVTNETDIVIDYKIYPSDVIEANLE